MFAARTLGSAERWPEVWELNKGRTMDDGATFTQPWKLHAGWQLELPAAPVAPPTAVADCDRRLRHLRARYRPVEEIVVVDDDNLWNLCLARLRSVERPRRRRRRRPAGERGRRHSTPRSTTRT